MGQVIVSVDVTDKGRVVTSFVSKDGKGNKNKAFVEEITEDIKKESSSLSQNHAKKGYNPGPMEKDSLHISILRMLTDVNDVNDRPFINEDGSGNFDFTMDSDTFGPYEDRVDYEANKQFEEVKKKYRKTKEFLKAPNGLDTNLDRDTWIRVRTPLFKQWFGDWQNGEVPKELLDENGEPKVFYHQTSTEFDTFDVRHKGAGATDNETPFGVCKMVIKKHLYYAVQERTQIKLGCTFMRFMTKSK